MAILSFFSLMFLHLDIQAQVKTITGKIISATDRSTLPGVNVVVKGSTVGTVTDLTGYYNLPATSKDVLIISYIGYVTQEIPVGDKTVIDVVLEEEISDLDEVVVIGYGTQQKKLVTGATVQVKGDQLEQRNSTSAIQALQGQTPGVNITTVSGQPGEQLKVTVRGIGTVGEQKPLYIVDGVPTGDIEYLNPADIETIDVLKDAASAAIYGNRGANGVVLITTRKGSAGKSQITFDAYYGLQNRAKKIRMLNSQEYAEIMNEQYLNSGGAPSKLPFDLNNLPAYTSQGAANTDWLDEMFVDNAVTQNYVLGATGGSETSIYSLSVSYTGQEGIVGGKDFSDYNRLSGRFNTEFDMYDKRIKIGENFTFAYIKSNGIQVGNQYGNTLRSAFNASPLLPVYNDDGDFFNTADKTILDQNGNPYWNDAEANPYASMYYSNQNDKRTRKVVGNVFAEIYFLENRNLKFRSSFGIDHYNLDERSYTPIYQLSVYSFQNFSKATQRMENGLGWINENVLTYTYESSFHRVVAMAGMSLQSYKSSWMYGENADIAFDDLAHAWLNNATNTDNPARMKIQGAPNDKTDEKLLSYFGRIEYGYKNKYLFNATFRADGSSKFAEGNRWGYFPSFSAGWVLSSESFMESTQNTLSFLKLRASWGQNGSSLLNAFQYLAPIKFTQANYNFGDQEGVNTPGAYPSRLSNENVKWETSEQLDFGFDAYLFDSFLSVNFDWYRKQTKDWLIKAPIYATAGTDAPFINGGDVINSGVELALGIHGNKNQFQYHLNVNGAYNKNDVQNIPTDDGIIHGKTNQLYNNAEEFYRAESGHAIGYFWGWETNGIFQTTAEVDQYVSSSGELIQPNAKPGDLRYVDQNDDGVINDDDKVDLGDPSPDFTFGLNFNCSWKGIDFLLVGYGVAGNQIVQSYRSQSDKYANYTTAVYDNRWTGPGTSNEYPRVTNTNINWKFSDIYVYDGSFFRISNISLGYDLARVIKASFLSQLRIYVSVQNLYTFTKYPGMDPEVGYGIRNKDLTGEDDPSSDYASGIDLGFYPRPRTYLVGLNVKF